MDAAKSSVTALILALVFSGHVSAASFMSLGFVDGRDSRALAISGDGTTVVGWTNTFDKAFVWSQINGMVPVSAISGSTEFAVLWDVSNDGSIASGSSSTDCCGRLAATWTSATGMVDFDKSDDTFFSSRDNGLGISDDGRTVVGYHQPVSGPNRPLVWKDGILVTPAAIPIGSIINSVSADGSKMVGEGPGGFIWSESDGYQLLGGIPGGTGNSSAKRISGDGTTVVGDAGIGTHTEAFRWTAADGMMSLGLLAGLSGSIAFDVSANGEIIVGSGYGGGRTAFIWDAQNGIRSLQDVLQTDYNVDLTGWDLTDARGVSYNGNLIAGFGTNPDGRTESWVVNLTPVPGPAAFWLFGSALGLLGGMKRRQSA